MCGGRCTASRHLGFRAFEQAFGTRARSRSVRCDRLLGRKNPAFRLPRLFKLNVPEQSDDALAQRHKPASFACLALGVEIKRALPVNVLQAHSDDFPVSQARVQQ